MVYWQYRSHLFQKTVLVAMVTVSFVSMAITEGRKHTKQRVFVPYVNSREVGNSAPVGIKDIRHEREKRFDPVEGDLYRGPRGDPHGDSPHSNSKEDPTSAPDKNSIKNNSAVQLSTGGTSVKELVTSYNKVNNKSASSQANEESTTLQIGQMPTDYISEITTEEIRLTQSTVNPVTTPNPVQNSLPTYSIITSEQTQTNTYSISTTFQYSKETREKPFLKALYSTETNDNVDDTTYDVQTAEPVKNNSNSSDINSPSVKTNKAIQDDDRKHTTGYTEESTYLDYTTNLNMDSVVSETTVGSGEVPGESDLTEEAPLYYSTISTLEDTSEACVGCKEMKDAMKEVEELKVKYNQLTEMVSLMKEVFEKQNKQLERALNQTNLNMDKIQDNVTSEIDDIRQDTGRELNNVEINLLDRLDNITQKHNNIQDESVKEAVGLSLLDLSKCNYVSINNQTSIEENITYTDWCPHADAKKINWKIASVYCSTYGGTQSLLEKQQTNDIWQYRCLCKGTLLQTQFRYCEIHLWHCPLDEK